MNEANDPRPGIHRRDLLKGAAASAGIGLTSGVTNLLGQIPSAGLRRVGSNLIQLENAKPGTCD